MFFPIEKTGNVSKKLENLAQHGANGCLKSFLSSPIHKDVKNLPRSKLPFQKSKNSLTPQMTPTNALLTTIAQSSTRTLFTMLLCSQTHQQCLIQQSSFSNWEATFGENC